MDWQRLDLAKASSIAKEVDTVLAFLNENSQSLEDRAVLVDSIQSRIQELEYFISQNNDGKIFI